MPLTHIVCLLIIGAGLFAPSPLPAIEALDGFTFRRARQSPAWIYYPLRLEKMSRDVEIIIEDAAPVIAAELGLEGIDTFIVVLTSDEKVFQRLYGRMDAKNVLGFADMRDSRGMMVIKKRGWLGKSKNLDRTTRHELSHVLLRQRLRGVYCAAWFNEGLAMVQSCELGFWRKWSFWTSIENGKMIYRLEELWGHLPFELDGGGNAYTISFEAVDLLFHENPHSLATLMTFSQDLGDFEEAFYATYHETLEEYSKRSHKALVTKYKGMNFSYLEDMLFPALLIIMMIICVIVDGIKKFVKKRKYTCPSDIRA